MATQSQHRVKARGNRAFLDEIDASARADWAVVVAFYTAVHLIEDVRAGGSRHSLNHRERLDFVRVHHRAIFVQFQHLYTRSLLARYDSNAAFYRRFANADIRSVVIDGWLAAIKGYVAGLTSPAP